MADYNLFSECGLNPTEQTVLTSLLEHGASGAARIAKRTELKRPTVYAALNSLVDLGVVQKKRQRGSFHFSAASHAEIPKLLKQRAEREYQRVNEATSRLPDFLLKFPEHKFHSLAGFEIETFESLDKVYQILEEALLQGEYSSIVDPQAALVGPLKKAAERVLKQSAKSKAHIREIMVAGPLADWWIRNKKNPNQKVKLVKWHKRITTDILLADGYVILHDYAPGKEMAIRIRHAEYFSLMQFVFDTLWNSLEEI